jgi:hypothetical protein
MNCTFLKLSKGGNQSKLQAGRARLLPSRFQGQRQVVEAAQQELRPPFKGSAIDSLRTGLPHWLTNHHQNRESEYGQFGLSYLPEIISRVFNTERGAVQLI